MIRHSRPTLGEEEKKAVNKTLLSGYLTQGKKVREFEQKFRGYIGTEFAVATNSGTSALHLALAALEITSGDEVIIPSFVCTAVLNAINYVGAKFRIVDIDIFDYNISFKAVKKVIRPRRTKAVIVPHMFGHPADIEAFLKLGIPVIEDCALSLGATYKKKKVGSFGLISIFSFYATKMLTTAEGGMVLTNNKNIAQRVLDLRDYDEKKNYETRFNYKMSDLNACLGLVQLGRLEDFIRRRREIAAIYDKELSRLEVVLPHSNNDARHVYSRYVIRVNKNRGNLLNFLKKRKIECKPPVFKPLHRYLGLKDESFPQSNLAAHTAVSLPIYPSLKNTELHRVVKTIKDYFTKTGC